MTAGDAVFSRVTTNFILHVAGAIAWRRPLVLYPGWRFETVEADLGTMARYRSEIWKYCNKKRLERPIVFCWLDGIKIYLYLGNDISRLLYVTGCMDPNEFVFLSQVLQPGMTFIDVGANDGVYTLFASKRVGQKGNVLAIEPSEREYARLEDNLLLNGMTNVQTFRVALSNLEGEADMAIAEYEHEGQNTLGQRVANPLVRAEKIERVRLMRLDDLLKESGTERVDFIKIDIEGSEMQMLEGSESTICKHRPILQLEFNEEALRNQGSSKKELFERVTSWGYCFKRFVESGELTAAESINDLDGNVIATPVA